MTDRAFRITSVKTLNGILRAMRVYITGSKQTGSHYYYYICSVPGTFVHPGNAFSLRLNVIEVNIRCVLIVTYPQIRQNVVTPINIARCALLAANCRKDCLITMKITHQTEAVLPRNFSRNCRASPIPSPLTNQ